MALELEPKKGPFSRKRNTGARGPEGSPKMAIFNAFHHHGDCKMAMLPQLFSLSGLAVELGMDRRTVAAKLRNVRPDGNLPGGTPGWRLNTALRTLDGPRLASSRSGEFDLIADLLEGRLADPAIVTEGDRILLTVSEAAQMLETDCETVLLWLRTGAPYFYARRLEQRGRLYH